MSRCVGPRIGIVDYGSGNLRSVQRAIEHAGGSCILLHDAGDAETCSALVVPGVGSFGDCARQLQKAGLWSFIREWVRSDRPYLGICLGYQLLFESSEESPGIEGLGVLKGKVLHFSGGGDLKIPHMGWNQLRIRKSEDRLMQGLGEAPNFYFVHSYYPAPEDEDIVTATCSYGLEFAAGVTRGNLSAVQFHPEKSQELGLAMLRNFINSLDPSRTSRHAALPRH